MEAKSGEARTIRWLVERESKGNFSCGLGETNVSFDSRCHRWIVNVSREIFLRKLERKLKERRLQKIRKY